jgi:Fur family transcriptional regulator, peroxide stress response regulator
MQIPNHNRAARVNELVTRLREKGHRITPQRLAILKLLVENESHPSVEQVYEQIRPDFPTTSLATVYKTVNMLKEEGEILELGFANHSSRYDSNRPYSHPHLICIHCQDIIDAEVIEMAEFPDTLTEKYGYQILNHRVDFYGICPKCQMEAQKPE